MSAISERLKMKFLRVSGIHYVPAKQAAYLANPELQNWGYERQLKSVFSHFFHYGDSLTEEMQRLGYESREILYDLAPLQKKWAQENGFAYPEERWQTEILIRQILTIRPDILLLHNLQTPSFSILSRRKELFPFLQCLIVFRGYPEADRSLLEYLSLADLLLVGSPILERICKGRGLKPHLFYHYFDKRVLQRLYPAEKTYPCTFLGTSGFGFDWVHQPRYFFLHELLKERLVECWLEESSGRLRSWKHPIKRCLECFLGALPGSLLQAIQNSPSFNPHIQKLAFNGLARKASLKNGYFLFPKSPLKSLFPDQCHPPIFGLEMYQALAQSRITFNIHSFAASGTADNIRLFQATGAGSCLITDRGSNLHELFEIDREVVVYSSLEECKEKIKFLIENEAVRDSIASKGKARTLQDHTAARRALELHEALQNRLSLGK